ncbi:discoidin domain-containing protein [Nonomuraea sediminis]|uniref:discoidin domain-containing protein n=1 Tax=Nonomuraea sediminis TaxID=2835864 RepID=UPI001BDD6678|nr:discoidin domain-containing protein [Nonomuraea sediminis]
MRRLAVAALALLPLAAPAQRPPATILVVQANLQDAVRQADVADTRDLDNFAKRVAALDPDALVLTEVVDAKHLATRLSQAGGHRYQVAVAGERSAFLPDGAVRENAILLNADTMVAEQPGGFERVQDEDQAHVLAKRRDGTLRVSLVAAHPGADPAAARLGDRFPHAPGQVSVLGGDFRAGRCAVLTDQSVGCSPQPFWAELTGRQGYSDAVFEHGDTRTRPGYLFAHADVLDAGVDSYAPGTCKAAFDAGRSGSADAACRSTYYADAPFSWALLRAERDVQQSVIPGRVTLDHCELATRVTQVMAKVVNNTDQPLPRPVTAEATAPLTVTPAQADLTIPAHQARNAVLKITAPRDTPPGEHRVKVRIGAETTELPVTVTESCTEPKVYATSFHPGFGPERAVDGDISTFWHSEYDPVTPLPQSITLNLEEVRTVSALTYQPRFDGNLNGTILAYNVYVSTDGQAFTQVATGTWAADARLKTATFPATSARYVRLEGTKGNGGQYLSASEVTAR